ncbi:transposase [Streptomyces sp. NPDC001118]
MPLPRAADGRIVPAADVSPWLRPDPTPALTVPFAAPSDGARASTRWSQVGRTRSLPLETGRTSWTAVLDAVRLEPSADVAAVTTVQLREVVEQLVAAGQWKPGDLKVVEVLDAGYDAPRIAHMLGDLLVEVLGRLRSDRVMRRPTPLRVSDPKGGQPPKHGGEFGFGDPATCYLGHRAGRHDHRQPLYGKATAQAWDRLHPRLTRRAAWIDQDGPLPSSWAPSSV